MQRSNGSTDFDAWCSITVQYTEVLFGFANSQWQHISFIGSQFYSPKFSLVWHERFPAHLVAIKDQRTIISCTSNHAASDRKKYANADKIPEQCVKGLKFSKTAKNGYPSQKSLPRLSVWWVNRLAFATAQTLQLLLDCYGSSDFTAERRSSILGVYHNCDSSSIRIRVSSLVQFERSTKKMSILIFSVCRIELESQ